MALINSNQTTRLVPPHEPESWFDCRPIRAGDLAQVKVTDSKIQMTIDSLASLIMVWSYPEPVTRENVAMLDIDTFVWLEAEVMRISGVRSEAEKKESANDSSVSQPHELQAVSSSPQNSTTY